MKRMAIGIAADRTADHERLHAAVWPDIAADPETRRRTSGDPRQGPIAARAAGEPGAPMQEVCHVD